MFEDEMFVPKNVMDLIQAKNPNEEINIKENPKISYYDGSLDWQDDYYKTFDKSIKEIKTYKPKNKYFDLSSRVISSVKVVQRRNEFESISNHYLYKNIDFNLQNKEKFALEQPFAMYTGNSNKINLMRYIYGQLFISAYKCSPSFCKIEDLTSKIYSWRNYLIHFQRKGYIKWLRIRNIDSEHSILLYEFDLDNLCMEYNDYLNGLMYNIDIGRL